jgi:hypothetical protein
MSLNPSVCYILTLVTAIFCCKNYFYVHVNNCACFNVVFDLNDAEDCMFHKLDVSVS